MRKSQIQASISKELLAEIIKEVDSRDVKPSVSSFAGMLIEEGWEKFVQEKKERRMSNANR